MSAQTRTHRTLLLILAIVTFVSGTLAIAQTQTAANYVIGPQDVLAVQVYDSDINGKFTVEADGSFSFPLIGRIQAAGRTLRQFEEDLKKRLADGYFRNPQVAVSVDQYRSQRIFVLGEVRTSGPLPLTGGMTLVEALARAGSPLPSASGEVVVVRPPRGAKKEGANPLSDGAEVFRATIRDLESGRQRENIELQDGDTIYVPRADTVYVFGEVRKPDAYPMQKGTTVLQALALAGGATEHAALNRIKIVRIVRGETKEIKAKLTDIVLPGDTIKVPERYF